METNHNKEVWRGGRGVVLERCEGRLWSRGVGKAIGNEWEGIKSRTHFSVENERKVKFWKD